MSQRKRKFEHRSSRQNSPPRKLFIIATEGMKTEPQYFRALGALQPKVNIYCPKRGHSSSPVGVLSELESYLAKPMSRTPDEVWIVVDKDHWTDEQLAALYTWEKTESHFGLAISNPKFEFGYSCTLKMVLELDHQDSVIPD